MNLKSIAKDFDLKLIYISSKNINKYSKIYGIEPETLKNNSYIIGDTEIILGFYEDEDSRNAAFFHEIGHSKVSESYEKLVNYNDILIEYQAWIEGIKIAKKYKYKFSERATNYMIDSLKTYHDDKKEEINN
jgi:hypothetical protein